MSQERDETRRRQEIMSMAIELGRIDADDAPIAAFLDLDGVQRSIRALETAFPPEVRVLHAFAVKASPIVPVLDALRTMGMGCEVASEGELAQALAAGHPPERIVFDSPAKRRGELRHALRLGIGLHIDNLQELDLVRSLPEIATTASMIGIRVNPQVGSGGIASTSTAGADSKFGVPLGEEESRTALLRAYREAPWLRSLHAHVGSQGCPLSLIVEGLARTVDLADAVNAAAGRQQITRIDIGGGMPVDFASSDAVTDFSQYVEAIARRAPRLLSGDYELVTEFGRSILAKHGFIAAHVAWTKTSGGRSIAITHAGAQVAARTVYAPDAWPLRVAAHTPDGSEKTGEPVVQTVAGPCCFAGDLVAVDRRLPLLQPGDIVALLDTGAYYASSPYSYNSLLEPGVYGFSEGGLVTLREPETLDRLLERTGAGLVSLEAKAGATR